MVRSAVSIMLLMMGSLVIAGPVSAAPKKKFTEAEIGKMRDECRQEAGKQAQGKAAAVSACVKRKKGK